MRSSFVVVAVCLGGFVAACGEDPRRDQDAGTADGSVDDAASRDAGSEPVDASTLDASSGDAATGSRLRIAPESVDFGELLINRTSAPQRFLIRNDGTTSSGPLSVFFDGDDWDAFEFGLSSTCEGADLSPGGSCFVDVAFFSTERGAQRAGLFVSGAPGFAAQAGLSVVGYYTGFLIGSSDGHAFDAIDLGDRSPEVRFWVTNPSDRPVSDVELTFSGGSSEFEISTDTCGTVVIPGEVCEIGVRHAPTEPGPVATTLTMDGDTGIPLSFTLTGTAITTETRTITIAFDAVEAASGVVRSTSDPARSPELDCTSGCTRTFMLGSVVTLRASGDAGSFSGGFSGGCESSTDDCTFTVERDATITATFTPANRIFTTRETYTLDEIKAQATATGDEVVRTTSGADAICRSLAGPEYQALIARRGDQVPAGVRGFVRPDGRPFATAIAPPSRIYSPPTLDRDGTYVPGPALLWSGIWRSGLLGKTCFGWSNEPSQTMDVGNAHGLDTVAHDEIPCTPSTELHLLCFQTRYDAFVVPPPAPANARRVFLSTSYLHPTTTGGLATADAYCANEARTYSLPGTYRAMLATESASIASRFSARAEPIYRLDGVRIADDASSFFATSLPFAPIAVHADGLPAIDSFVWSGAVDASSPGVPDDVCLDPVRGPWRSGTGRFGDSTQVTRWLDADHGACARAGRVYCLQE